MPWHSRSRYLTESHLQIIFPCMRSLDEHTKDLDDSSFRELRLLEEVDSGVELSQRKLALRLGIALGVANLLVRRLASRGYIKVTQLGWRRWAYVVTPNGMARKLHLTLGYVERFFEHYRRVRYLLRDDLRSLPLNRESRVAIVGTTELAELAFLALRDIGVDDIEVFERSPERPTFLGMRVQELETIEPSIYAKIVIADFEELAASRDLLNASGEADSQMVVLLQTRRSALSEDSSQGVTR